MGSWAHAFSGRAVAIPAFQKFFHVIALTHLLTPYITDITCPLAPLLKPVLAIRSNHVLRLVSPSTDLPPGPTFGYHKFAQFFNVSHFHLWLILSAWRKKRECPSLDLLEQNFARGSTKFGILKIWATKHILALKHCLLTFFNNHICSCPSDNRCALSQ